jgi:ribonucleoside-diphosphate reductase alpha chain
MASHNNFKTENNNKSKDRNDIYNSAFESPIQESDTNSSIISRHKGELSTLCSYLRFYPDVFYDMLTPEKGGIKLDLYQRVMMRSLARFPECYFCIPRGGSKTLTQIMVCYHTAICYPNITVAITASTKESAVKIWKEKHEEILRYYPSIRDEIKSANFSKDSGRVEFQNGAVIDNLANAQSSKGLRRRRGSLEESALIDKDLYEDAIEPIFNVPRVTMSGEIDPTELNGQINRFSTSGYKNSDEYEKILAMTKDMYDLKGTFVFGSDWYIPVHFGRQKRSTIDKARRGNVIRFKQNYLCEWIGVSDGGLINISKLIKARTLDKDDLEFECPKDKKGNFELNEYVISMDVARSESENNNKTAIIILKIIRNKNGRIRQVRVVNIITPPNGLNFSEQTAIVKRLFYKYGGSLDETKSRVKAIIVDANGVGSACVDCFLEEQTDNETNQELGCFDTINTDQKPQVPDAPKMIYALKAQSCNKEMIVNFIDYVESSKLKLVKNFQDIKNAHENMSQEESIKVNQQSNQIQRLVDEVSNLKLKTTNTTTTVMQVVKKIDKDRYSALIMGLFYINSFMDIVEESDDDDRQYVFI